MKQIAIVIGATGLIGKQLVKQLLADPEFASVKVFTRRPIGVTNPKLTEFLVDFKTIKNSAQDLKGDVLFSTLGTTLKTAGSKEAQYAIDYDMQFDTAKIAAENGVKKLVLVSSAGANAKSSIFYSRMKGELDEAVQDLGFESVHIIRPSMLAGDREEFRWGEKLFTPIMYAFSWIPGIKKYRPIQDTEVAQAMINASKTAAKSDVIYELEAVFTLVNKD